MAAIFHKNRDGIPREKRPTTVDTRFQLRANQTGKNTQVSSQTTYATGVQFSKRVPLDEATTMTIVRMNVWMSPHVTRRWQADSVFETKEHGIQIQKETICPGREPATRVSSKRLYETVRDVTTLAGEH